MSNSILITGAQGQVGRELAIAECPLPRVALNRKQLDITNASEIDAVFEKHRPGIVINAAAYTQVDQAEKEVESTFTVNRDGVANLAVTCQKAGIPLLHISSDYVFDGSKQEAYTETDPVAPLGVYGQSKAQGEAVLQATIEQHIILRSSWVFSSKGNNFVNSMLRLGKETDKLTIVNDQRGCPTAARSIAAALLHIARRHFEGKTIEWGIYHYCGTPSTTWYDFAREIFQQAKGFENLELEPIASCDFPTLAQRPANSVLDCSAFKSSFDLTQSDWRTELALILDSRATS